MKVVESTKFLGVHIDNHFNWKTHINHVTTKLAKVKGVLLNVRNKLTYSSAKLIYNSIILLHLNYCSEIWGNTYKTSLTKIVTLQKQAVRVVHKSCTRTHSYPLFREMHALKFEDIVTLRTIKIAHQAVHGKLPPQILKYFEMKINVYPSRKQFQINQSHYQTNVVRRCLSWMSIKLWNELDQTLTKCKTLKTFAKKWKRNIIQSY